MPEVTRHQAEEPRLEPTPEAADPAPGTGRPRRLFSREMVQGRISTVRREGAEDGRVTSSLIHMEFILCVRYGSNFMFFQKVD